MIPGICSSRGVLLTTHHGMSFSDGTNCFLGKVPLVLILIVLFDYFNMENGEGISLER